MLKYYYGKDYIKDINTITVIAGGLLGIEEWRYKSLSSGKAVLNNQTLEDYLKDGIKFS